MAGEMPGESAALLLDRYRVERALGEGGLGAVVCAFDTRLKRRVAIKTLKRSHVRDETHLGMLEERFTREAEAGSRMGSHPNLVTVIDLVSDTDRTLYLILEYVPDGTLAERIARGALPLADALRLTAEIARGLHAAHRVGLVHRDVKPANIFLGAEGQAQVGDFGIAQIDDLSHRTHATIGHPGTPLYMSPEQASTTDYLRPASDQYSLGLVLFEMLTGAAYKRLDAGQAATLLVSQPRPVAPLIERMLAHDPADRYPSMAEVGQAIRRIERAYSLTTTHEPTPVGTVETPTTALDREDDTVPAVSGDYDTPPVSLEPTSFVADRLAPPVRGAGDAGAHVGRVRRRWVVPVVIATALILLMGAAAIAARLRTPPHVSDNQQRASDSQQRHYDAGEMALAAKDYDTAIAEFGAAGQYRDAPQRVVAVQQTRADATRDTERQQAYDVGTAAIAKEDYAGAAAAFARAGNYADAPHQAIVAQSLDTQQRQYQAGDEALGREDYTTAAVAFRTAGLYRDAPARAAQAETLRDRKVSYDAGASAFLKEDFKTAKQSFLAAGDYKDAPQRAAQAEEEDGLLTHYTSAQIQLKAARFKEAYIELQAIKQQRATYKDVNEITGHLENDIANPITIDLFMALNQGNAFKEAWLPVPNLIGQPVAYLYLARTLSYASQGRPELITAVNLYLVAQQGSTTPMTVEIATFATDTDLQTRNLLQKSQKLFVVASSGQIFETPDFGKYHAKYTVTSIAVQTNAPVTGNQISPGPVFTRLALDVTLTAK